MLNSTNDYKTNSVLFVQYSLVWLSIQIVIEILNKNLSQFDKNIIIEKLNKILEINEQLSKKVTEFVLNDFCNVIYNLKLSNLDCYNNFIKKFNNSNIESFDLSVINKNFTNDYNKYLNLKNKKNNNESKYFNVTEKIINDFQKNIEDNENISFI